MKTFKKCLLLVALHAVPTESWTAYANPTRSQNRKAAPAAKFSAAKSFAQAKQLFDDQKFMECIPILGEILKRYPDHNSAQLLMAKSYYRLERQQEAYAVFSRMNPQFFDPETSYEFATTMYKAKQYPQALYAYKNVPKNHPLHDLSNYYGALSALKLRKFKQAEDMMERAVVLPDKLAQSRTTYLKHLIELRTLREKQALTRQKKLEKEKIKRGEATESSTATAESKDETSQEYKHMGSVHIIKGATVSALHKTQNYDLHGFGRERSIIQLGNFSYADGPMWGIGSSARRPTVGLQIKAASSEVHRTGEEKRNFVYDSSADILRIHTERLSKTTKWGEVALAPFVDIPAPHQIWIAVGGGINFLYYNFERSQREGNRGGFVQITGPTSWALLSSRLTYNEYFNPDNISLFNQLTWSSSASYTKWPDVLLNTQLIYENFDYLNNNISGPDTSVRLIGSIGKRIAEMVIVSLIGSFDNQMNNILHNVGPYPEISADGYILGAKAVIQIAPWEWMSLNMTSEIQQANWQVINPGTAQDAYERNHHDILQTNDISLTLNLMF